MKTHFSRRIYTSFGQFWQDVRYILARRRLMRAVMRGGLISAPFRERLMLAVTQVNGCPYCSYFHAKEALRAGLSPEEVRALGEGVLDQAPAEEIPALLYAQHWAESNAQPDPEVRRRVEAIYGPEVFQGIELALRAIRVGNLLGNTWDYLRFRLGLGRPSSVGRSSPDHPSADRPDPSL